MNHHTSVHHLTFLYFFLSFFEAQTLPTASNDVVFVSFSHHHQYQYQHQHHAFFFSIAIIVPTNLKVSSSSLSSLEQQKGARKIRNIIQFNQHVHVHTHIYVRDSTNFYIYVCMYELCYWFWAKGLLASSVLLFFQRLLKVTFSFGESSILVRWRFILLDQANLSFCLFKYFRSTSSLLLLNYSTVYSSCFDYSF